MTYSMNDLIVEANNTWPGAQVGEDNDGQVVVYTGLVETQHGLLAPIDEVTRCPDCDRVEFTVNTTEWEKGVCPSCEVEHDYFERRQT